MKPHKSKRLSKIHAVVLLAACTGGLTGGATAQTSVREANRAKAAAIAQAAGNGIHVDKAKVYDDAALQLMLNAAKLRLAALQSFDQTALTTRIGAVTGASLQQQAFSANVLGPTLPGSTVTDLGGTGSTQTINAPAGRTITTNAGQPVQNVTTNNPQLTPSAPGLPSLATTLPSSGFNVSSLDALNEMMQLTYEIANLQLLLEGSLSDRFVARSRIPKPRTTLGFSISIATQERFKDAVAMVEIVAIRPAEVLGSESPSVTALLPREKTYNVAAITDNMSQIGGGVVSQVISGGVSFLRGRKTYYLVQDQDTLAMVLPAADGSTGFSWQFRPVLGRRYVKSGLKQTFAQLTMPIPSASRTFGWVRVRTYWQKFDRKGGVLKEIVPESINDSYLNYEIPVYDPRPMIQDVSAQDVGNGVLQTAVTGSFMTGTYVRVGSNFYRDGSPGFTSEMTQIRFLANAGEIARHGAYFVNRDGTETPIHGPLEPAPGPAPTGTHSISAFDAANSLVTVAVNSLQSNAPPLSEYVIVINGKVLGLSDAPIERVRTSTGIFLRALVPNSLLFPATDVWVKPLFWSPRFGFRTNGLTLDLESTQEKIVVLGKSADGKATRYLLYGSRLNGATIIQPHGITFTKPLPASNDNTLQAFDLTAEQEKGLRTIVIVKPGDTRPVFVAMPAAPAKPTVTAPARISAGTDEIVVTSDYFDRLKGIKFKTVDVLEGFVRDKTKITLTNLNKKGVTSSPGIKKMEFDFGDADKVILEIEVVSGKVELLLPG